MTTASAFRLREYFRSEPARRGLLFGGLRAKGLPAKEGLRRSGLQDGSRSPLAGLSASRPPNTPSEPEAAPKAAVRTASGKLIDVASLIG